MAIELDHGHVAVPDRGDEAGRIDLQKLRVVLDTRQQIDGAEPIRKPHFLQQPDDPETPAFAKHGDHCISPLLAVCNQFRISLTESCFASGG